MGIQLPTSSQGSVSTAQFKPDAVDAVDSWYIHRVLYEPDRCDLYLYKFLAIVFLPRWVR